MTFDAAMQRQIMGCFATGVTVVTTRAKDESQAMTANALTSLSLDPPLVLVCVELRASMHAFLSESKCFAVSILAESQEQLSTRFAQSGPKRLDDLTLTTAETGSPILAGALAYVDCRVVDVARGGDHDIFIGEIVAGDLRDGDDRPLLFYRGKYAKLAD